MAAIHILLTLFLALTTGTALGSEPLLQSDIVIEAFSGGTAKIILPKYNKTAQSSADRKRIYFDEFEAPPRWLDWRMELIEGQQTKNTLLYYRNKNTDIFYKPPTNLLGNQAMAMRAQDFHPGDIIRTGRVLFRSENLSFFDGLKIHVHGGNSDPLEPGNETLPISQNSETPSSPLTFFCRLAPNQRDTTRYFEYQTPLLKGWQVVNIDLDFMNSVLATQNDSQALQSVSHDQATYRVKGFPHLTDIETVWVGFINTTKTVLGHTHEVWIEELYAYVLTPESPFDFNDDGNVNFSDFILFAGAYGARADDENYSTIYDSNKDGAINFSDFLSFVQAFTNTSHQPTENAVETRPQLLRSFTPQYPEIARSTGVEGRVVAQLRVGKDGRVHEIKILSGPEIFWKTVLDTLYQFAFIPALQNGSPVSARMVQPIQFRLR